jgi:hypothetical protein
MKRARKPAPPDSFTPWLCIVLAIDPGRKSGWALFIAGRLDAHGDGNTHDARTAAVLRALDRSKVLGLPLVVVGETWKASRNAKTDARMNPATLAGLGAAWGLWAAALEMAGVPKARVMRVAQNDWKRKVVGTSYAKHAATLLTVRRLLNIAKDAPIPEDELAAMGIGLCAIRLGRVGAKLPKPRTPRAQKAKDAHAV